MRSLPCATAFFASGFQSAALGFPCAHWLFGKPMRTALRQFAATTSAIALWHCRTRGEGRLLPLSQQTRSSSSSAIEVATTHSRVGLYFFSNAAFRPLRDHFVASIAASIVPASGLFPSVNSTSNANAGFDLRETCEEFDVNDHRTAGGPHVYLFKTQLLLEALDATEPGGYFVISDVDIQFLGEVFPIVAEGIAGRDMCFQREFHELGVNIGFMAIRRSEGTIKFWRRVLKEVTRSGAHDQKVVNNLLYGTHEVELGLRWGVFPPQIWASSQAFDGGSPPRDIALHHANWVIRPEQTWRSGEGSGSPYPKLAQLVCFHRSIHSKDRRDLDRLVAELLEDPALGLYFRKSFGEDRRGPEWAVLPVGHPARLGGHRRRREACNFQAKQVY
eukprot:TRINITY_DN44533_c0_g1_i1.p1 TRINITY_DN44533_c0_g1~~TRINITY_DN44533_c0_g1_i1.p1  ORF type:complete len:389 (-),score=40.72 TRINITY_DN44533_c0_g1_i1:398-1564(-)